MRRVSIRRAARIIPARAGFTARRPIPAHRAQDHPRSRGVYAAGITSPPSPGGSSPLARGLLRVLSRLRRYGGIIPARAGCTDYATSAGDTNSDHPRSRGVYLTRIFGGRIAAGIIPARAGFTAYNIAGNNIATDHPRSRGVYFTHFRTEPANEGSSPLARGLLWAWQCPSYRPGIIPARAGFTVFD